MLVKGFSVLKSITFSFGSLVTILSLFYLPFAIPAFGQQQFYTLEVLQTKNKDLAGEQALLISGLVTVNCRIVDILNTYHVRCGNSADKAPLTEEQDNLVTHGLDTITLELVEDDSDYILEVFEPINLGAAMQENLLAVARNQQTFNVSRKSFRKPKGEIINEEMIKEKLRQGKYFLGRGWAAYEQENYDMASNQFQLASNITMVKLPAAFGLALSYYNSDQYRLALPHLELLVKENYEKEITLPLMVNTFEKLGLMKKMEYYYDQMSAEEVEYWKKQMELKQLNKDFEQIANQFTHNNVLAFEKKYGHWAPSCEPEGVWLQVGQSLVSLELKGTAERLLTTLWQACKNDGIRIGILYQFNHLLPFETRLEYLSLEQQKEISDEYSEQLEQFRLDSMMQYAAEFEAGSDKQGEIYAQMSKLWPANTSIKLATAWWLYHKKEYQQAFDIFERQWLDLAAEGSLQGMLYAMLQLQQLESAIKLATKHNMPDMALLILKEQLSKIEVPSVEVIPVAKRILGVEPRYGPAYSALAWTAMAENDWLMAQSYFHALRQIEPDNLDATKGLIQSLVKQQLYFKAQQLASTIDEPGTYDLQHEVLFDKALVLFNNQMYREVEPVFETLLKWQPDHEDVSNLYTWTLFHVQNYQQAAKRFLAQYEKTPNAALAQGYLGSLENLNKLGKRRKFIRRIAQSEDPDIRALTAPDLATQGDLIKAAYSAPDPDSYYAGVNSPEFWLDYNYRNKKGDAGISAVNMGTAQLGGSFTFEGGHRIEFTLNRQWLDAEGRESNPLFGSNHPFVILSNDKDIEATGTHDKVWSPWFHYLREDDWDLIVGVGVSGLGGPLGGKLAWSFSAVKGNTEWDFHRTPIIESQLSYTGLIDPYTGRPWGQVSKTGVGVKHSVPLWGPNWLSLSGEYDRYAGTNLIGNQSIKANVLLGRSQSFEKVDLSFGIISSYSGYQRNSVFSTFGHGGYFSPRSMVQTGLFAHAESNKYIVNWWQMDVSVGYFNWETDPEELFPLDFYNQRAEANEGNGISYSVKGEKHWKIGDHFELGVGGELSRSPGYEEWQVGVIFRYFWKKHNYLIRKHPVHRRYYN